MTSDPGTLLAEVAHLARAFHWPLDVLLDLEHADRRRFIELSAPAGDDGGDVVEL